MENNGQCSTIDNMSLSQSYSQGVERIRKRMNNNGPLKLPKEILIQREHAWDKLFEKYSKNVCNDIELNINDSNSETKRNGFDDDDQDKNEKDENEYFSKCRTPMRKHPALVQYWVDTGNPPYQLIDDNSSVTGSSLSEVDNVKSTSITANECANVENRQSNSTSLCSSVDTIAYILSNTNVTKKSEAIAIMEGVKNTNTSPGDYANCAEEIISSKTQLTNSVTKSTTLDHYDNGNKLNELDSRKKVLAMSNTLTKNVNVCPNNFPSCSKKSVNTVEIIAGKYDVPKNNRAIHNSIKITDVLPTLARFDEILKSENFQEHQQDKALSDDTSLFEVTPKMFKQPKSFNRKKLYTERNSPIDIIVSVLDNKRRLSRNNIHPALCTPTTKRNTLFSRRRTSWFQKRRKKRFLQLTDTLNNSEKIIDDEENGQSGQSNSDKKLSECLKLTPNDESMCHNTRTLATDEMSSKTTMNRACATGQASCTIDSSENKAETSINESRKLHSTKKLKNLIALCSRKKLEVRLERYREKIASPNKTPMKQSTGRQPTVLSSPSSRKLTNNVHKLGFESQDSDQSTILIYKCVNDQGNEKICCTEDQHKWEQVANDGTQRLRPFRRRKRNNWSTRKTRKNVEKITENSRKTHKTNYNSVTNHNALILRSGEDSPTQFSPKLPHRSRTRSANPVINFSSDEDEDFLQIVRRDSKTRADKVVLIDIPASSKHQATAEDNPENIKNNVTDQSTDFRIISTPSLTAMNLTIIESDDDEIIHSQKFMINTKRKNTKRRREMSGKSPAKVKSITESSHNADANEESVCGTGSAKVLQYNTTSCAVGADEKIALPTKKLKLHCNGVLKTSVATANRVSETSVNSNSHRRSRMSQPNTNISCKNENNETFPKNNAINQPETLPSCKKESSAVCSGVSVSLKKLRSFPMVHSPYPLSNCPKVDLKVKFKRCIDRDDISDRVRSRRTFPSTTEQTTGTVDHLTRRNDSIKDAKRNISKLIDISTSNNRSIHNCNDINGLSSIEKTNEDDTHKSLCEKIFPSLFDDSSSDSSLKFNSSGRRFYKMNKPSKNETIILRTKSDDSESDESICGNRCT